jgi:cellobiose phosphorylase
MGVTDEPQRIPPAVARYRDLGNVHSALAALRADWDDYLSRFTVETPDPVLDAMVNVWNPIQCRTTLYWSRFVSGYETGTGRGMGTRDSAQDTFGTVHSAPARARRNLDVLWHLQYQDGHAWHQVMPLTGEGGPGLAAEFPEWPQWFSDDHLWLVLGVCAYLRETGDYAYLEAKVAYWDGGEDSIWNHMMRAVEFTLAHRGPRGLPRLGFSDWDDTMNLDHGSGKAESVWSAQQFCRAMLDLADLSEHLGRASDARRFRGLHSEMARIVNEVAWDGGWYARAYDDEGRPVGVAGEEKHRINLNTQTWAVIGEVASHDRACRALDSAHEKLNSRFGLALLWPPYVEGDLRVRGTTTFPPGAKENGGIFCHANTWAIVAAARLGLAERALLYYKQITPLAHGREGRALRVLRQHRRPRARAVRLRTQRLAHGHGDLGLRRGHAVDPRHQAHARRSRDRTGGAGQLARVRGPAAVPRRRLPDHRSPPGQRSGGGAHGRRPPDLRDGRAPARPGREGAAGRGAAGQGIAAPHPPTQVEHHRARLA